MRPGAGRGQEDTMGNEQPDSPATAIGKRYQCAGCGTMVLCLRPAKAPYRCCGELMPEVRMQQLPSGD